MSNKAKNRKEELNVVEQEMKEMAVAENTTAETANEITPDTTATPEEVTAEPEKKEEGPQAEPDVTPEEIKPDDTTPEKVKLTPEEWRAKFEAFLRRFPRELTIAQLIAYRQKEIEEWLPCQRIPSHTKTTAEAIIDSALQGISLGVITLGHNTETDGISTINGSSRIDDFIKFYNGDIGKKDNGFKELPKEQQTRFLKHTVDIVWLEGTTAELIRDFLNLNNNTALTGGQKAFGKLVGSSALDIISELKGHSVFTSIFSTRQIQKEEPNNCLFLILANIMDCYASSISKVTENLASKDCSKIDVDKLKYIFDKIESAEVELNKFKLVHLVHLMYIGDCWKSKSLHRKFEVDEIDNTAIGVCASVNYQTAGTNSTEQNDKRIEMMSKKLYLHLTSTGAGKQQDNTSDEPVLNPSDL